jgi:multiple sugar transport system substrate-binding protein
VIGYLRALIPYSPTDLRSLQWVRSAQIFGRGQAAMGYHWSNRYGVLDSHILLQKGARVGLLPHPTFTPDIAPVTPLGGALLAIPTRGNEAARQSAWRAVETLTSAELMKYFVMQGAAGNARFSVAEDRYVLQRNRVVGVMDQLAKAGQIQAFPSPAAVHYHDLTRVLSDHLESLLFDDSKTSHSGLAQMQRALESIEGLTGERAAKRTNEPKAEQGQPDAHNRQPSLRVCA